MERRLVAMLGTSAKHILVALEKSVRAILVTFFITAPLTFLAVEAVAFALTREFPPAGPTHLAAAAIGIVAGYAAAITTVLVEFVRGIIKVVELIVEESEKLAAAAVKEGELLLREGGTEALKLGRGALSEAGTLTRGAVSGAEALGRGALNEAGTLGRDVAGVVGGVGGAIGREVHAVESHLPGHHPHPANGGGTSNEPGGQR